MSKQKLKRSLSMLSLAVHDNRQVLKKSFETGKAMIFDHQMKRLKSSTDLTKEPDQVIKMLRRSPQDMLGAGSYGSAHRIKDEQEGTICVAKVSVCSTPLIGSLKSPYRSENVENRMAQLLWKYVVETQRSPHICMPLGEHRIVAGVMPHATDKQARHSAVGYMEHAKHADVRCYFQSLAVENMDEMVRLVLFQVTYTLVVIQKLFPKFRHHDLKDDNVLLQQGPKPGTMSVYKVRVWDELDMTFYVPGQGIRCLIGDFDYSCIPGLIDNGKVLEENFNTPTIHVNTRQDFGSDLFMFITSLLQTIEFNISDQLMHQLERLYNKNQLKTFTDSSNYFHPTPSMSKTLPSASRVLMSDLFRCYRVQRNHLKIVEEWNATVLQNTEMITFPKWDPELVVVQNNGKKHYIKDMVRRVPLIYPRTGRKRHVDQKPINPSMAYFATWKTKPNNLDQLYADPCTFKHSYWKRILPALEMVYLEKPDKRRKKQNQVGFFMPKQEMESFLNRVLEIGQTFIDHHWVSPDWWPAVFTMAFVDTVWEFDLIPVGQTCWYMDSWCEHWSTDVKYTKRQMLQFALQWSWLRKE